MKKALLALLAVGAVFLARDMLLLQAHAVEPVPLSPHLGGASLQQTTITRNDGGTLTVPLQNAVCLDSNSAAKVGAVTTKVNVATATTTAVPTTALVGRRTISLQNHGPNPIWCCFVAACTPVVDESWQVAAKAAGVPGQQTFDVSDAMPVRCKASTADQVNGGSTIALELQ